MSQVDFENRGFCEKLISWSHTSYDLATPAMYCCVSTSRKISDNTFLFSNFIQLHDFLRFRYCCFTSGTNTFGAWGPFLFVIYLCPKLNCSFLVTRNLRHSWFGELSLSFEKNVLCVQTSWWRWLHHNNFPTLFQDASWTFPGSLLHWESGEV